MNPYIRILGSADWHPTKNNDHSCYTVCDRILIDACPSALMALLNMDVDPLQIDTICFTHLHADHYMGLPALLLHWRVHHGTLGNLTIVGPKATVQAAVDRAVQFVFHDSRDLHSDIAELPKVVELEGESEFSTPEFRIQAMDSDHAVPGLCYRITHLETGKVMGFTGDTRYLPAFGAFFKDADVLLHECSFGGDILPEGNKFCRHASAREAVNVCNEANVRHLILTHTFEPKREGAMAWATEHLSIPVHWATPYHVFEV